MMQSFNTTAEASAHFRIAYATGQYTVNWELLGNSPVQNRELKTFGQTQMVVNDQFGQIAIQSTPNHLQSPITQNALGINYQVPSTSPAHAQNTLLMGQTQVTASPAQPISQQAINYQSTAPVKTTNLGNKKINEYFQLENKQMQDSNVNTPSLNGYNAKGGQLDPNIAFQIQDQNNKNKHNASLASFDSGPPLQKSKTMQVKPKIDQTTRMAKKRSSNNFFESAERLSTGIKRAEMMKSCEKVQEVTDKQGLTALTVTNSKNVKTIDDFALKDVSINPQEPIILATFLLPYNIVRDKDGSFLIKKCFHNPTMLYATLENMAQRQQFNFKWVGLLTTLEELSDNEKETLRGRFKQKNAYPIFMTVEETALYMLFYENILRPLFHNFKDLYNMRQELIKHWKSFIEISMIFADKIVEVKNELAKEGQTATKVWIHNNQLIMVPLYVKKQFEAANIGFCCHSPFPSSAHFRVFKYRYKILESILHCDLIAFHLFMYARNFIKTCDRILGLELEFLRGGLIGINFQGKHVIIRVQHIGIEESFLEQLTSAKPFKQIRASFRSHMNVARSPRNNLSENEDLDSFFESHDGPIIMGSIDSYHPISGLKHKLQSYLLFLQKYPNYRNKIIFIQFVGSTVQAFDSNEDHQKQVSSIKLMRDDIIKIVDTIHERYGKSCLIFEESNPSIDKRLVLWTESDIIWCSSLKDGLCIQVLEYVVCRKLAGKMKESVMLCSEFAGCNEAMRGVLRYNPFSLTGFEEMMDQAMNLSRKSRYERMQMAYNHIQRSSMTKWTEDFLKDLIHAYQPNLTSFYLGLSFTGHTRQRGNVNRIMQANRPDFTKLNFDQCYANLLKAKRSVIIIEMEALPHQKFTKQAIPTAEVIEQLHSLLSDQRNTVILMGNHAKKTMENWFLRNKSLGFSSSNFWLVAESGYLYKAGNEQKWRSLEQESCDFSWIKQVRKIMQGYTDNIDGSFIEERESCIIWNYKNTEQEHATMFIHDLYNTIKKLLQKQQKHTNSFSHQMTEIISGNGYLEVKPTGVKKEKLVQVLLGKIAKSKLIDFLFYLGNEPEDEAVFEFLKQKDNRLYFQEDCVKFSCVLEKKPSEASYYIEDQNQVRLLLQKFQTATQNRKRNFSSADLPALISGDQGKSGGLLGQTQNPKRGSIANLNLYMNTNITLGDQNQSFVQGSYLTPYQQRTKGSLQNLSVNNQIIEEDCKEHSDEDDKLAMDPKPLRKFGSDEDTRKNKSKSDQVKDTDGTQVEGGQPVSGSNFAKEETLLKQSDLDFFPKKQQSQVPASNMKDSEIESFKYQSSMVDVDKRDDISHNAKSMFTRVNEHGKSANVLNANQEGKMLNKQQKKHSGMLSMADVDDPGEALLFDAEVKKYNGQDKSEKNIVVGGEVLMGSNQGNVIESTSAQLPKNDELVLEQSSYNSKSIKAVTNTTPPHIQNYEVHSPNTPERNKQTGKGLFAIGIEKPQNILYQEKMPHPQSTQGLLNATAQFGFDSTVAYMQRFDSQYETVTPSEKKEPSAGESKSESQMSEEVKIQAQKQLSAQRNFEQNKNHFKLDLRSIAGVPPKAQGSSKNLKPFMEYRKFSEVNETKKPFGGIKRMDSHNPSQNHVSAKKKLDFMLKNDQDDLSDAENALTGSKKGSQFAFQFYGVVKQNEFDMTGGNDVDDDELDNIDLGDGEEDDLMMDDDNEDDFPVKMKK